MMKVDSARHHNRVGKQSREQSRAEEANHEGERRDESKTMPEWTGESRSRHVLKTPEAAYFLIVDDAS